jgi:hypothetical protein
MCFSETRDKILSWALQTDIEYLIKQGYDPKQAAAMAIKINEAGDTYRRLDDSASRGLLEGYDPRSVSDYWRNNSKGRNEP